MEKSHEVIEVGMRRLKEGMILVQDVTTAKGMPLISKGQEVGLPFIERLKNVAEVTRVKEPMRVIISARKEEWTGRF